VAADGTKLKGLPSGEGWVVNSGHKARAPVTERSVGVDDGSLGALPDQEVGQPTVEPSGPSATCVQFKTSVAADKRAVARLQSKLRRARSAAARRTIRRKLAKAKKRLARDRAGMRTACPHAKRRASARLTRERVG
jgi:hypothetical protein